MIASWMLYATLVTLLLALAARAAEKALTACHLPVRWAWLGAAVGALALPAAAASDLPGRVASLVWSTAAAGGELPLFALGQPAAGAPSAPPAGGLSLPALPAAAEPAALALWVGGSVLLVALAIRSRLRLRHRRRGWEWSSVEGVEVLASEKTGPAVIGVLDPVLVLPGWVLELAPGKRRMVLRHELEHRDARDPVLLAAGLAALVASPWNPALWWIVRRLQLAIELDCDRRVLADGTSPGDYGALLLEITRGRRVEPLPVAGLGERNSRLERRIRAMTETIPTFRTARVVLLALVGAGLLAAACDAPTPAESPDAAGDEVAAIPGVEGSDADGGDDAPAAGVDGEDADRPAFVPRDEDPRAVNDGEIRRLLEREYPEILRSAGVGGTATVWLFVDREGTVTKVRMQESSGYDALDRAAMSVAPRMEFEPATRDGQPEGVWVSRSINFAAPDAEDPDDAAAGDGTVGGGQSTPALHGDEDPLILVDGEHVEDGRTGLADLRPDEIESIEVIKGAAAVELYGEEGRDGIIRITTKAAAGSAD